MPAHIEAARKRLSELTKGYAGREKGLDHLSPSSMNDLEECSHKMRLRSKYRFYSIYAKLGNIFHSIFELYGSRKLYFMQHDIPGPVFTQEAFDEMKDSVVTNMVNDTRTAVLTGKELLPTNVPDKIKDQIGDMDLFEKIARHISKFVTMQLAEDAAIDGKHPIMQEVELRGVLGKNLPFLGFGDSVKVSLDMHTVYVDDYKTTWTPASKAKWEKTIIPTRQFWIYDKLARENIKHFVPSMKHLVPRLVLVVIDKAMIKQAMSKTNKRTTLKDVLNSTPEISLYIKELPTSELVDAQYTAEIQLAEVMLENGIEPVAKSMYGCDSCSYNQECPYYSALHPTPEEEEDGSE